MTLCKSILYIMPNQYLHIMESYDNVRDMNFMEDLQLYLIRNSNFTRGRRITPCLQL